MATRTAIILAAGRGSRLGDLTSDRPKCLIEICGRSLIHYQVSALRLAGISHIYVVAGYRSSQLASPDYSLIINEDWRDSNMVSSLLCGEHLLESESVVVSYSDIIYAPAVIESLIQNPNDITVAYDPHWILLWRERMDDPLQDAETFQIDPNGYITEIGNRPSGLEQIAGQYMGLIHIRPRGWKALSRTLMRQSSATRAQIQMTKLLQLCVLESECQVSSIPNDFPWCEIDTPNDLRVAEDVVHKLSGLGL